MYKYVCIRMYTYLKNPPPPPPPPTLMKEEEVVATPLENPGAPKRRLDSQPNTYDILGYLTLLFLLTLNYE